jgi:hypothetical protein
MAVANWPRLMYDGQYRFYAPDTAPPGGAPDQNRSHNAIPLDANEFVDLKLVAASSGLRFML